MLTSYMPLLVISDVPLGTMPGTLTLADAKFVTSYMPLAVILLVPVGVIPLCGTDTVTGE